MIFHRYINDVCRIIITVCSQGCYFCFILILLPMAHSYNKNLTRREPHPRISLGIFLITLGIALLIATNDLLNLGSIYRYFTWETALIFIGVLLLLNLHFTGGLLMVAGGVWFLLDEINFVTPEIIKTLYWPAIIVLIGITYIISSFFRRIK